MVENFSSQFSPFCPYAKDLSLLFKHSSHIKENCKIEETEFGKCTSRYEEIWKWGNNSFLPEKRHLKLARESGAKITKNCIFVFSSIKFFYMIYFNPILTLNFTRIGETSWPHSLEWRECNLKEMLEYS